MHRALHRLPQLFFAILMALAIPSQILAEEKQENTPQLEPMVVTAHKTEENKQDIPANVTVMNGMMMQDFGVENIDELVLFAPNINIDRAGPHGPQIVFRGVGGITNMNKVYNINVDGVTVPYVGVDTFLDVERVELLRGSQGSLYGRNSFAGVVNVISRKPTPEFSFHGSAEVESYNTQNVWAAFGGPAGEKSGYRLALGYRRTDGYTDNTFYNTDDSNNHEQLSGRATLVHSFSPDNKLTLSINGDKYDGGFDEYAPITPNGATHKTQNNEKGSNKGNLISPTLTWEKKFSDLSFISITNYSNSHQPFVLDQDFTSADIMVLDFDEDIKSFSQEFRLSNDPASSIQWLAGLFLMAEQLDSTTDMGFGSDAGAIGMPPGFHMIGDSSMDTQGVAVFGQVKAEPINRLEIIGRLRVDWEKRELDWKGSQSMPGFPTMQTGKLDTSDDWLGVMPSVAVSYLIQDDQRIYATIDRGYKVGNYNYSQVTLEAVEEPVDPEYTLTYEVGYKGLLVDRRLELNLAAFYIDWTDMQVSVMKDNVALMQNAAEAHSYGMELEARFKVAAGFELLAGFGWLNAEFDEYDNHPTGQDLSGNKVPNANEYSLDLGAIYRHPGGFFASASGALMGPKYLDEQNLYKQDSYTLISAKIGYESKYWSVYAYGRNLLDEEYYTHSFSTAGRAGAPAIIGAQLTCTF